MKLSYPIIIVVASLCGACSNTENRKSSNGMEIRVLREGAGNYAEPGQVVVMNMVYKDDKDSVWFDTRKQDMPAMQMVPDTSYIKQEMGIENTFRSLKKGDSVAITVTTKSFFEKTFHQPVPPGINPDVNLTFLIGVIDITDREGLSKIQEKLQGRQLAKDTVTIDAFLITNGITAVKHKSGLRYIITRGGAGDKPTASNIVKVNYKGFLLENGRVFDQSQGPVEFRLDELMQGWQIGFQLLQKGCTATLYVPSTLGYGLNGAPPDIPGNANLVFEVELVDFR